jgi:hypothetical protein
VALVALLMVLLHLLCLDVHRMGRFPSFTADHMPLTVWLLWELAQACACACSDCAGFPQSCRLAKFMCAVGLT